MKIALTFTFAASLAFAVPVAAQGVRKGPVGPGPIGAGPTGHGPLGPAAVRPAPVGPGLVGRGPFGPGPSGLGPIGPGPVGPGPIGLGPGGPGAIGLGPMELLEDPLFDGLQARVELFDEQTTDREREAERRAREAERRDREAEQRERHREREADAYTEGYDAISEAKWDRAIAQLNRVVEMKGPKADGALYWKSYAQNRLGQRAEALTTIAELTRSFPNSPYIKSARALEVEVRRDVGQPVRPQDQTDEDLKLMAIQALQNSSPEQAIPMLEKVLAGSSSPRVKERALFVLAQSDSPRAREIVRNLAKGGSTPELQSKAIQYLGVHGGSESRAMLGEVYSASNDVDVKRRILRAFMVAGEKDRLWKAAQGEQNADLRAEAVRQLGVMGAHEELWQLYQKETSVDVKKQVIKAMFVGGNADRMIDLARTEKTPDLRREAIRSLGLMGSKKTGDALVQIYGTDRDPDVRKGVIQGLFLQGNAAALVGLARKEDDMTLKREIVQKLSLMDSKIATDFMIELLGK
jgi:HEAT repeat protein